MHHFWINSKANERTNILNNKKKRNKKKFYKKKTHSHTSIRDQVYHILAAQFSKEQVINVTTNQSQTGEFSQWFSFAGASSVSST